MRISSRNNTESLNERRAKWSGQTKQHIEDASFEGRILTFSSLTWPSRSFTGEHKQSLARKPLFLLLLDASVQWVGLEELECTAHSPNSQPIKNLAKNMVNQRQGFVVLRSKN